MAHDAFLDWFWGKYQEQGAKLIGIREVQSPLDWNLSVGVVALVSSAKDGYYDQAWLRGTQLVCILPKTLHITEE
eukprot:11194746-Lingulodinium_polyedra.AAC.1